MPSDETPPEFLKRINQARKRLPRLSWATLLLLLALLWLLVVLVAVVLSSRSPERSLNQARFEQSLRLLEEDVGGVPVTGAIRLTPIATVGSGIPANRQGLNCASQRVRRRHQVRPTHSSGARSAQAGLQRPRGKLPLLQALG